ncbi:helix-turn-helix domain-containing protein [Cellulomonas carbonis]|uniref:helix-turn-helix domain-containing protein n=1 Tax=Cellulomonas carbonis TaxID=1386092 RepID=UPI001665C7D1|nr:helix-turn-helix domain-containing protein [Cellulomonas carbonis]
MGEPLDELFEGLPRHLSVEQLAEVLGVSRPTAYNWLNRRVIPAYKVEATWVILRDEVKSYLRSQSNQARATQEPPAPVSEEDDPPTG